MTSELVFSHFNATCMARFSIGSGEAQGSIYQFSIRFLVLKHPTTIKDETACIQQVIIIIYY